MPSGQALPSGRRFNVKCLARGMLPEMLPPTRQAVKTAPRAAALDFPWVVTMSTLLTMRGVMWKPWQGSNLQTESVTRSSLLRGYPRSRWPPVSGSDSRAVATASAGPASGPTQSTLRFGLRSDVVPNFRPLCDRSSVLLGSQLRDLFRGLGQVAHLGDPSERRYAPLRPRVGHLATGNDSHDQPVLAEHRPT